MMHKLAQRKVHLLPESVRAVEAVLPDLPPHVATPNERLSVDGKFFNRGDRKGCACSA